MNVTTSSSAEERHTDSLTKHPDTKKLAVETAPTMHPATVGAASTAKAFRQIDHPALLSLGRPERHADAKKLAVKTAPTRQHHATVGAASTAKASRQIGHPALLSLGRPERYTDTKKLAVKTAPTMHRATVGAVSTAKAFSFFTAMRPARQLGSALGPHRRTRESSDGNASC